MAQKKTNKENVVPPSPILNINGISDMSPNKTKIENVEPHASTTIILNVADADVKKTRTPDINGINDRSPKKNNEDNVVPLTPTTTLDVVDVRKSPTLGINGINNVSPKNKINKENILPQTPTTILNVSDGVNSPTLDINAINDFIFLDSNLNNEKDILLDVSFRSSIFNISESALGGNEEPEPCRDDIDLTETTHPTDLISKNVISTDHNDDGEINKITKRGTIRKRKSYGSSLSERKKVKLEERRKKFELKPPCENCIRKCASKISQVRRQNINNEYWSLDWVSKRRFVLTNSEKVAVLRKHHDSSRKHTFHYFCTDENGTKIQVCKTFFLTTLGYEKTNDKAIMNALTTSEDHLTVKTDMRGKSIKLNN